MTKVQGEGGTLALSSPHRGSKARTSKLGESNRGDPVRYVPEAEQG